MDYETTAFDPDAGNVNGAGIDTVKFVLGYAEGDDPYGEGYTLKILAVKIQTSPPYIFHVETDSLPDEAYRLIVWAKSQNGGGNKAVINHIIDNTGPSVPTSVDEKPVELARKFQLQQNYPNPFNPSTQIFYSLSKASEVELTIYNVEGQKVRTLVNEFQTAGQKSIVWSGLDNRRTAVSSGVYFFQLRSGVFQETKKMILLR